MLQALEIILAAGIVIWALRVMLRRGGYDIARTPRTPEPRDQGRRDEA